MLCLIFVRRSVRGDRPGRGGGGAQRPGRQRDDDRPRRPSRARPAPRAAHRGPGRL